VRVIGGLGNNEVPWSSIRCAGVTSPHPNAGCLLFSTNGQLVGSGCQRAQGSTPSEVLAAAAAREAARGATAYMNLETGDCHGEEAAVAALVQSGVSRVVVGLRHPLAHLRWVLATSFGSGWVGEIVSVARGGQGCW
jgi:pyrimidine deaminase RibD-like protein